MELIITNKRGERFTVLYDECDHELISKYKWYVNAHGYSATTKTKNGVRRNLLMHRLILGLTDPKSPSDHKNRNGLDNRRDNLRTCTQTENNRNRRAWGRSKFLGVSIFFLTQKGRVLGPYVKASIRIDGNLKHLGSFSSEESAARAYDDAARIHFGEFANLNFNA